MKVTKKDIIKCMRCHMNMEKKEENKDGVWYSCDECLKQEEEYLEEVKIISSITKY